MGSILKLGKWVQQKEESVNYQQYKLYYYTRKMQVGKLCIKPYCSHIFIQRYENQEELIHNWKKINRYIAIKYQSKTEIMIEKSNFYFCLFISGKIDLKIKSEIESDSFCAKKYVFEENNSTLQENILEIENKIFSINSQINSVKFPKLERMVLQNFRGYMGKITIDFKDRRGMAASFVVIYATNGIGKTSLFDGVEYALKGEVGRIVSLTLKDKKDKMRGAIYHNRYNKDKDAFVSMILENKESIIRKVSKVLEGKDDCRYSSVAQGQEITGIREDKEKWDQIILPHDKIDSFISAKSPTAQYKEWVDSAAPLKMQTQEFESRHKSYRFAQKKCEEIKKEYTVIENKLNELSQNEVSIKKLFELIDNYNNIVGLEQKIDFSKDAGVEEYDELINQVKRKSRILDTSKAMLENNISLAEEILNRGVSFCLEIIESVDKINRTIKNLDVRIQRIEERNTLLQCNSENVDAISKSEMELAFIQRIVDYGIERVKDNCKLYTDLEIEIDELERSIGVYETELKNIIGDRGKIELEIKGYEKLKLTEEEYKEALDRIKKLDNIKQELKDLKIKHDKVKESIEAHYQTIILVKETIEKTIEFRLPKDIINLRLKEVPNISYVLNDDMKLQLYDFEDQYRTLSIEMQICQEEINKQEIDLKELDEISQKGIEYLNIHKDINECPLCHTVFENWETLFLKINNIQERDNDSLKKRLEEYRTGMERLHDKYDNFYIRCMNLKTERTVEQKSKLLELEKYYTILLSESKKYEEDSELLDMKQKELELWFVQKSLKLSEISIPEIKVWQKTHAERILHCQEKLNQEKKKQERIQKTVNSAREQLNTLLEQKNNIVGDSDLYSYILFSMKQSEEFNCLEKLEETKTQLIEYKERKKEIYNKLLSYKDVENADIDFCRKAIGEQLNEYDNAQKLKERYSIFVDFTESGIKKYLLDWSQQKDHYERQIEYLSQISEENGARNYFENFRNYYQELKNKEQEYLDQMQVVRNEQDRFEKKQKDLENGLKSYFNQSIMNEIYKKIDPHDFMKDVEYDLSFNDKDEPQLCIRVCEKEGENIDSYRPEWYFSTAQLNTVAFSSFFGRALVAENISFRTIFIDDPIGHFDDMNILGFTDLIRSILEKDNCQIIMSTHDEKIFRILERKLDNEYYSSCFIQLPESEAVVWKEK